MTATPENTPKGTRPGSARRDEEALEQLFHELPSGAQYVLLQRQNDRELTVWDHVTKIPADQFSLDAVRDQFGGGKYRTQVVGERGRFISEKIEFSIDARFKPKTGPLVETTAPAPAAASEKNDLQRLMELLTLMRALAPAPAPQPDLMKDSFAGALKIAELLKASQPAAASGDTLATFLKGIEFARDLAPATAESDPLAALAHNAEPVFVALAENMRREAEWKAKRRGLTLVPGAAPAAVPSSTTSTARPMTAPSWQDRVRTQLPQLLKMAAAGKDHELYGDLILDQVDDATYADLQVAALRPDFVESTLALFPEVQPQVVWFRALLTYLQRELTRPAEDAPATESAATA